MTKTTENQPKVFVVPLPKGARSPNQAADEWGCSRALVRKYIEQGRVETMQVVVGDMTVTMVLTKDRPEANPTGVHRGRE